MKYIKYIIFPAVLLICSNFTAQDFTTDLNIENYPGNYQLPVHKIEENPSKFMSPKAEANAAFISDFRANEQVGSARKTYTAMAVNDNNFSVVVWNDYREGTSNIYAQIVDQNGGLTGNNIKINSPVTDRLFSYPEVAVNDENQFLIVWYDYRYSFAIYGQLIDETGSLIGENFMISDEEVNTYKSNPAIDSNGEQFVIMWTDGRLGSQYDLYAQRIAKDGSKIGANFIVNSDSQSIKKVYPDLAIDQNGNMLAVWNSIIDGKRNIFASKIDSANMIYSEPINFSDAPDNGATHYYPRAAVTDSGFTAVWYKYYSGNYEIKGQFFNKQGGLIDSAFILNDNTTYHRTQPTISSDNLGNTIVTWYDYRNGYAQIFGQKISNNTLVGNNFQMTEETMNASKVYPTNGMNNIGRFAAAWIDYSEPTEFRIYARTFNLDTTPIISSTRCDDDEKSSMESDPTIEVFNDGSFIIAWTDGRTRGYNTYFQMYNAEGNEIGNNIRGVSSTSEYNPQIVKINDGNFVLIWREYYRADNNQNEIVGQKYFRSGEKIGEKFLVSNNGIKGSARTPDAASNSNGEFVVTWGKRVNGYYRVFAKKYDNNGNPSNENISVSADTVSNSYRPRAGIDSDGNFAVAYYAYVNNNFDIYLGRYNAESEQLDSVIIVNNNINGSQYYSDISVNDKGECIVVWFDYGTNGINFQKFSSIGSKENFARIDSNFAAADYQFGLSQPSVSLQNSGEFVISWNEPNSNFDDLKFRVFNSDLSPLTEVLYVSETQKRNQIKQRVIMNGDKIYNVWQTNHEPGVGYDIWGNVMSMQDILTDVNSKSKDIPQVFNLSQNYPNPFNPSTIIAYSIPPSLSGLGFSKVQLKIYDVLGREIRTLVNENKTAGNYVIKFEGSGVSSGIYFYTLQVDGNIQTKKMTLLK